jgi:leucyl aminopeptidase
MKSDKAGGSTVVSLIKYAMLSDMPIHLIGLIPLIENSISGNSVYPGNIIRSYNGTTVEILDTDAEGRVIMADALGYAGKHYKDLDYIIDIATLTGAAEAFHCDTSAAYYTSNKQLAQKLESIGEQVGERVYALPSWPEYITYTKSAVADVKNHGFEQCSRAGAFMATMFLMNFVEKKLRNKWIHLDLTHNYSSHFANANGTFLLINLLRSLI